MVKDYFDFKMVAIAFNINVLLKFLMQNYYLFFYHLIHDR
jgi:hypothetical protein